MTLEPLVVTLILTLVLPVVVGLITKAGASAAVKNTVLVVTTAVATLINTNLTADGVAVISWETFAYWGIATLGTIAAYLGFYKPVEANDRVFPDAGIGSNFDH